MIEITMNAPGKNALGTELFHFLLERLELARGEPVLLEGSGDAFSAGLNLKQVASLDASGMEDYLRLLERCMSAFYQYPAPIVAHVNGHAIAGGCVLALACDQSIATKNPKARIGLNEVAIGVRFPPRVMRIVRARVPRHLHERVLLGAGLFAPEEARAMGLVDETADDARLVARARLDTLAAHPRDAYAATKRVLRGERAEELATDEEEERWMRGALHAWTSAELKARIAGKLGK